MSTGMNDLDDVGPLFGNIRTHSSDYFTIGAVGFFGLGAEANGSDAILQQIRQFLNSMLDIPC